MYNKDPIKQYFVLDKLLFKMYSKKNIVNPLSFQMNYCKNALQKFKYDSQSL